MRGAPTRLGVRPRGRYTAPVRGVDLTPEARAAALSWRMPGFTPQQGEVALFRNRALDLLTRSHPAHPYAVVLPIALGCLGRALALGLPAARVAVLAACGWLVWSFLEYAMHRWLFHAEVRSETARIAVLLAHGHHHVWPRDRRRIAATPIQLGSCALLLSGLFDLALDGPSSWAALGGALFGYVAYEAVHWTAHHSRPRSRLLRTLRAHHLRHHHLSPHARWGIGSPLWDWVFRSHR